MKRNLYISLYLLLSLRLIISLVHFRQIDFNPLRYFLRCLVVKNNRQVIRVDYLTWTSFLFPWEHERQLAINYSRFDFFDFALQNVDFVDFMLVGINSISLL